MKKIALIVFIVSLVCLLALSSCDDTSLPADNSNQQTTGETNNNSNTNTNSDVCQHIFGEWNVVQDASCKEDGKRVRTCNTCSFAEEETIPKTDIHTPITDAAVPATCKATGLTEGSHCSACNKVLIAQTTVPKNSNHSFASSRCSLCDLKVIEYGNADGSLSGGNNKVKYYVTGDLENYKDFEIVIYGNGEMPNFSQNSLPLWYDYLPHTVKIKIENGVTTIGKYAFYYPSSITSCNFIMSDTVKTIKSNAISLKIRNLTLGNGVQTVESNGIGNIDSIYIPRSVKKLYLDCLGNETYFYEGSIDEFYQIQMYVYNRTITVKDFIATLDDNFISNIHIYVQAKNISDRSHYWR